MKQDEAALEASDREARRNAQEIFDRPFVLEAGAGTGKTTTLVARIVVWAMGEGWQRAATACRAERRHQEETASDDAVAGRVLERIVAITFTEAAAAEMAERVGRALACLERGDAAEGVEAGLLPAEPVQRRRRARALLDAVDRLVVRTIHAFCRRLLAAHALEAGLHPAFEVDADGEGRARVARELVEAHLQRALADPEGAAAQDLIDLAVEGIGAPELEQALLALLDAGAVTDDLEAEPLTPVRVRDVVARLAGAVDAVIAAEGGVLQGARRTPVARETSTLVAGLRLRLRALPDDPHGALEELRRALGEAFPDGSSARLETWAKGEFGAEEQTLLAARREPLSRAAAELSTALRVTAEFDPVALERAHRVLRPLLAGAEERLRAVGVVSFATLLRSARDLLCRRADVAALVRRDIDQLLVDEFQDTDWVQCQIVARLALEGDGPRPGLFLVGDPKQSIYGWRSADLAAYDDFLERVGAAGGVSARLSVSRRSLPAILEEVSRLIEPVMREERGLQPAFAPLVPHPERVAAAAAAPPGPRIEHWLTLERGADGGVQQPRAARAVALEAAALARDLVETHARGVSWNQLAVLFRAFSAVPEYVRALEERGVPYVVQRDGSYAQRREVIEACALVRAILDPNDVVALVAWLRSVCVGVPDAAWIPLWTQGFPSRVAELRAPEARALDELRTLVMKAAAAVPADVPGIERVRGWEDALLDALGALAWLRRSFETEPSDVFVERVRTTLLLEATEGARFLGRFRVANLERFFRELVGWLAEPGGDVPGVLRRLRAVAEPSRGAEEGPAQDPGEDAVRVLTIHQAKGLDFGHVYLMQLHHEATERTRDEPRCAWHEGRLEHRLLGAPSLGWGATRVARAAVASAELVRTLYVATTRAKERLVLAGRRPAPPPVSRVARSHAELIASGRPPGPLLAGAEAALAAGDAAFELEGARCTVLGVAVASGVIQHAGASALASLADATTAAADSARLRALADEAELRAARPLRAAASEESHFLLHELFAATEFGDAGERPLSAIGAALESETPVQRAVATAVGTAVHRWLETVALDGDLEAALAASQASLRRVLVSLVPAEALAPAWDRTHSLLIRLARGPLALRLRTLAPGIVARELSVLLPPREDAGPVGFVAGAIDLVYRDPEDGAFVVADWKTDRVEDEAALAGLVRAYASQGEAYTRALREALALPAPPRFELWFLHPGRVVRVSPAPART